MIRVQTNQRNDENVLFLYRAFEQATKVSVRCNFNAVDCKKCSVKIACDDLNRAAEYLEKVCRNRGLIE